MMGYVYGAMVVLVLTLSVGLYVANERAASAELALASAQRDLKTATDNHEACKSAGVAWSGTVDFVRAALKTCTDERTATEKRGREAVERVRRQADLAEQKLAIWRSASNAAGKLPQCRGVLELELCPELMDY